MNIYLDMDGVLTDLVGALATLHGRPVPEPWPAGEYRMSKVFGVKDTATFWAATHDIDFWANMEWTPDGREILSMCQAKGRVYICTRPTDSPACLAGKYVWLRREIPNLDPQHIIVISHKHLLAQDDSVLIDDCDMNINAWATQVPWQNTGILVPRPWNRGAAWDVPATIIIRERLKLL